jgi:hypothetical protein
MYSAPKRLNDIRSPAEHRLIPQYTENLLGKSAEIFGRTFTPVAGFVALGSPIALWLCQKNE